MVSWSCSSLWASHYGGFSYCPTQAWGLWSQRLWCTDFVAPCNVEFYSTRDQTCVPCVGRQSLTTGPPVKSFTLILHFYSHLLTTHPVHAKVRSWHPVPSLHGTQMGKKCKQWQALFSWAPKSLQMVTVAMKLKDAFSLEEKLWQT